MSIAWIIAIIVAVTIIAALAFYAGKLLRQVKSQELAQEKAKQAIDQAHKKHDSKAFDSIIIIVRAMKEEQCDLSEGCWRLCVLLDSLKLSEALAEQFPSIYQHYDNIKHMPILEERKKLPKQERMKLDLTRMKSEAELKTAIFSDLELLFNYTQERLSVLKPTE